MAHPKFSTIKGCLRGKTKMLQQSCMKIFALAGGRLAQSKRAVTLRPKRRDFVLNIFLLPLALGPLLAGEVHVSPQGDDQNPGSAEKPYATLERARAAIRGKAGAIVWVHGGDYPVAKSFQLLERDSGAPGAPNIYRGVLGETVRLRGGITIRGSDFRVVTDKSTLSRIETSARSKVVELDLKALGLQHAKSYPDVFPDNGGLMEVYYKDRRMPLARFPNRGYLTMQRVLDNAGGITDRNWAASTFSDIRTNGPGGTFEYREEFAAPHANWARQVERGVWFKGYWRVPWQNEAIRVGAIDPTKRTVTFQRPIAGGIGSKYHRPEGSGQEKYWLMNLLEAVDRPGEWCVDFKDAKLYFYPPTPLADGDVVIADNSEPLVKLNGASHIVLRDLVVEQGLGNGIQVNGGKSNLIAGCTVRNVSRNGVVLDGGFGNEVRSCDLYWLGAGGVWLAGGDEKSSPRVPAGHRVINNHIHDFAQIERVYAAGVNSGFTGGGGGGHHPAVGMVIAHNLIHDTPHVGILHGSWDSSFEFNEILEYCQVSNDMGGIYCYDQFARMGNQTIRYNYIHSSAEGDGIYFDHDHRDMHVYGNIVALDSKGKRGTGYLYKIGSQAKGNPQTINCTNNIALHCRLGFEFVSANRSHIENNLAVNCEKPFTWTFIAGTNSIRTNSFFASGRNLDYGADPGFVNLAKRDYRLTQGARVFKDLPGFEAIPVEKIGLFVDEYRRRLPNDEEAGRIRRAQAGESLGVEIGDRDN